MYRKQYLSKKQLNRLLQYVAKKADLARLSGGKRARVDELIVMIMAKTGLQAKEFCNLNIRDVSVGQNNEGFLAIRNSKGKITRKMAISAELFHKLERFIRLYRKQAGKTAPLFVSERGSRIGYNSIYHKIRSIGTKAGIGKLCPMMLRHTFLLELFKTERDLKLLQEQAGYSSVKAAAIYANTVKVHAKNRR